MPPIKPRLTKSPKPKPQTAGIKGENAYRSGNRQTVREFGFAEFSGFGTRQLYKRWLFRCQNASPFCLTTLQKVEFPCFFKSSKTKAPCHIFPHKTLKTLHFPTKKRLHLPVQPHFYPTKLLFVNLLENNHRPSIYPVRIGISILFKGIPTVIIRLCPGSSICNYNPFFTGSRFRHSK